MRLIDVALGRERADLVIKGVSVVNVVSGEIYEADIAVCGGRIAGLGEYSGREEVDARGLYAVPGLIDGHTHIEMSMLSVSEFARVVVPRGTTAVVADPHEIANVLGVEGVRLLLEEAGRTPLKVFCMAPSCVPATPLETAGAEIGVAEIRELLRIDGVLGVAEMMNFPGVLSKDEGVLAKIAAARELRRPVDGHAPLLGGKALNAYVAAGIRSDHESTSYEEALEKLRLGMRVMVREGSAARNLKAIAPLLKEKDGRNFLLVTDGDRTPKDLKEQGYLDHVLRRAVEEGIDPVKAIQMCTINVAAYFGLDVHPGIGALAPGMVADIVLLRSLERFEVERVFVDGKPLSPASFKAAFRYPERATKTVRIREVTPADFRIELGGRRKVRIIGIIEGEILTDEIIEEAEGVDVDADILKIAVLERHGRTGGNVGLGFVRGFGLKRGAVASTVAHDSHNIVVIGTNDEDMALACNRLRELGGGIVVCDRHVVAELPLPIAGLMSDKPLEEVVSRLEALEKSVRELGCRLRSPFITMSFLALPVIPKLKITDKGLVDVEAFRLVSLIVD
ncbi:MAG: adenine deaminase [Candidatus Alkanophagales archaeon]